MTGSVLVAIAAFGFSAKAILVKLAYLEQVDSVTLLALRMAFSLPFFLIMALWGGRPAHTNRMTPGDAFEVAGLGLLGFFVASYLDFLGLEFLSAGLERLILFLYPTLVVILSFVFLRRPVTAKEVVALLLSYSGIALVFRGQLSFEQPDILLGAVLVFGSTVAYAGYLMGSHRSIRRLGARRFTAYGMTVACVACISQFLLTHPVNAIQVPVRVYGLSFSMALFSTVLPSLLLSMGIQKIGPRRASLVGSIGPVATLGFGYLLLGEVLSIDQLAGSVLVLAGVLVVSLGRK